MWNIYLLLAGRGYGKTFKGSKMIVDYMENMENLRIGLIGATIKDAELIMIEGVSGLQCHIKDKYKHTRHKRIFSYKTSTCHYFGAHNPEALRGFQFDIIWIDELCKFPYINKLMNQVWMCLRLGISKLIITTTPKNLSIFHKLMERNDIYVERGDSHNNKTLSQVFFKNIESLNDDAFYNQEVRGEIIGGITKNDITVEKKYDPQGFFILGIDPAVNKGLTGLILVQQYNDQKVVVEDFSTHEPYDLWIVNLVPIIEKLNCLISIEVNQGGLLWKKLLTPFNKKIITTFARNSKIQRQQFLHYLYKQQLLIHDREFPQLSQELFGEPADRTDALFYAVDHQPHMGKKIHLL